MRFSSHSSRGCFCLFIAKAGSDAFVTQSSEKVLEGEGGIISRLYSVNGAGAAPKELSPFAPPSSADWVPLSFGQSLFY